MNPALKRLARQWFPTASVAAASTRALRKQRAMLERHGERNRIEELARVDGWRVRSGPCRGVTYPPRWTGMLLTPKLLGVYESALSPAIEAAVAARWPRVVDVGAADGYYLIGLARRLPAARAVGFEAARPLRRHLRAMAELNGVAGRVSVRGVATPRGLRRALDGPALVLCDCEGAEAALMDPAAVPALLRSHLIVECHDNWVPGVSELLCRRFDASHRWHLVRGESTAETAAHTEYRHEPGLWFVAEPAAAGDVGRPGGPSREGDR